MTTYVLDGNGGVWRRYADGRAELAWDGNPVEVMGFLARLDATRAAVDALRAERDELREALRQTVSLISKEGYAIELRTTRGDPLGAWEARRVDDALRQARAALRDKEADHA